MDIIKSSEKPILASEIKTELMKMGLGVKNVRTISMIIHHKFNNDVAKTMIHHLGYTYEYTQRR